MRHLVFCSFEKGQKEFYLLKEGMEVPKDPGRYRVLIWPNQPAKPLCGVTAIGDVLCMFDPSHEHFADLLEQRIIREPPS